MGRSTIVIGAALVVLAATQCIACGGRPSAAAPPRPSRSATPVYVDAPAVATPAKASGDSFAGVALEKPLWDFGLDLLTRQAAKAGGDVVVSPVSLGAVLSMTMNGARGATADQMRAALRFQGLSQKRIDSAWADLIAATNATGTGQGRIADSLWLRDGIPFEPPFLAVNRDYYAADLKNLPADLSAAPAQINDWVGRRTGGRIRDLVSRLPDLTALVLVNTVYVKAGWDVFDASATSSQPFTLSDGSKVDVPMMRGALSTSVARTPRYDAVPIPTNGSARLWVIVPKGEETPESVAAILRRVDPDTLLNAETAQVDLSLPRFRVEYASQGLPGDLEAMGMTDAFSPELADFRSMTAVRPAWIDDVLQKTMIDVDETGVEAAAASAVIMEAGAAAPPSKRVIVRADRPFLVILTGDSGAPLFMGIVRDPR